MSLKISILEVEKKSERYPLNLSIERVVILVLIKTIYVMLNRSQFYSLVAQLNSYRKLLAQSVNSYVIPKEQTIQAPRLNQSNDYYFLFEQQQRNSEDAVVYGITCFDSDGVIIFNRRGVFPVSLWRYRRQGTARTATMFQGLVRNIFRNEHIPLEIEVPFSKVDDNIWQCHILWNKYNLYNS